jgi:hypothetical protein
MEEILLILGNLIILSFIIAKMNLGTVSSRAILALLHINLWYYFSLKPQSDLLWFVNIVFIIMNYYPWKLEKTKTSKQNFQGNLNNKIKDESYLFFDEASRTSKENLKRRYKFLMMTYHPDRTLNCSPEEKNNAIQKTIEINLAYQDLMKKNQFPSILLDFQ